MRIPENNKLIHYNPPQIRGAVVRAHVEVMLAARRAGKTTGVIAERISWNAFRMPRSLGGILMPSYKKFLTQFITSLSDGLESLGYVEDRDYVIGKRGPRNWEQAYHKPKDYSHAIHWRCGSIEAFISQDTDAAGAGLTLDRLVIDEAKHINGVRLQEETLAALSGHPQYFAGLSEHLSLLITSDRPYDSKGKWFYKYREQMDPVVIKAIFQLQLEIQHYETKVRDGGLSLSTIGTYALRVKQLKHQLNQLRMVATYWHEASTVENVHVVGPAYFKLMANTLEDGPFGASILNMDLNYVSGGFYPDLGDHHTYFPKTAAYTRSLGLDREARYALAERSSRHDAEIMPRLPLEIAMDYGGSFNCMAIGQMFGDVFRIDNGLHVYHPGKTKDVVDLFTKYYSSHVCKEVIFYFDHTAKGKDGKSDYAYYEIVIRALKAAGWTVKAVDIGQQPSHQYRYEAWGDFLSENGSPPFEVQWNSDNCEDMLISMRMAGAKQDYKGFSKNKTPEKDTTLDQAHATHYSDAVDTLVIGRSLSMKNQISLPNISGFSS